MTATIIEGMLSEGFLYRLGVYAQTCAHIEKVLWHVVLLGQGIDVSDEPDFQRAMRIRKVNRDLLSEAKDAAGKIKPNIGKILVGIVSEIESELYVRHMAVHGAWHTHPPGESHTCEYFRDVGPKGAPDWRAYTDAITDQEIDGAISKVDDLLRRALDVWQELKASKSAGTTYER
ncbi:hypothetical protein [Tabrizicola soli]|uniref:Uncharacterized protein n=1 Tax=Tabrizicola soli TaxID=2185115 RepID=A0ABV7E1Q3_9RHOB|nr:hypothetical protein [Tabrizicola soli]